MNKVYIDSNVFIYSIVNADKKAENAAKALKDMVSGRFEGYTSSLTFDEVMYKLYKSSKNREEAISQIKRILCFDNLKVVDVGRVDVLYMLNLMNANKKLDPRDAIHLSCALKTGCEKIISDDKDFDSVKEIKRIKLG